MRAVIYAFGMMVSVILATLPAVLLSSLTRGHPWAWGPLIVVPTVVAGAGSFIMCMVFLGITIDE